MTVPVVGLTGGIASGKSTVARAFTARGIPVIDADQLAREVVAPGSEGLALIGERFGRGVLHADGTLDRKALAALVFANAELRTQLNAITHPRIARLSAERIAGLQKEAVPYMIYEAPLIVENGLQRSMHALIVVALEVSAQIERMMQRDGVTEADALSRIAAQAPLAKKLELADYVIDNGQPRSSLEAQVERVHAQLVTRFLGVGA